MKTKPKLKLTLCPRCELNYMLEGESYCKICVEEMHTSGSAEEVELCSICNENPVMPGKDVCSICFQEVSGDDETNKDNPDDERSVGRVDLGGMDSVAEMDEIIPEMEENISDAPSLERMDGQEIGDIENPVSLEAEQDLEDAYDEEDEDDQ